MQFNADTMFPGDLYEAAARFATDSAGQADRPSIWRQSVAMGWPALLVDEALGGAGGTLADLGAVIEGCGREALGLPLVRRCAQVPLLLMGAGGAGAEQVLQAVCAGKVDADLADGRALVLEPLADGGVCLRGTLEGVDADWPFTHVLVVADHHLLLLPSAALPAPRARFEGIDGARIADYTLDGLTLPAGAVLQRGEAVDRAVARADDMAVFAATLEMAAMLGATIEHCVAYLSTRMQFGVALSTFQVLRHKVVDLYVAYESASVLLARLVGDAVDSGVLRSRDVALCKLYLNDLARRGAETSIQLHGGMGMTTELPAARLAQRLLCAEFELGDRFVQLARLADQPTEALA